MNKSRHTFFFGMLFNNFLFRHLSLLRKGTRATLDFSAPLVHMLKWGTCVTTHSFLHWRISIGFTPLPLKKMGNNTSVWDISLMGQLSLYTYCDVMWFTCTMIYLQGTGLSWKSLCKCRSVLFTFIYSLCCCCILYTFYLW